MITKQPEVTDVSSFAPPTPDPDDTDSGKTPSSRLDREVAEILARTQSTPPPPIPLRERLEQKTRAQTAKARQIRNANTRSTIVHYLEPLMRYPIITAVCFGILCAMFSDISSLLAHLFAIAAVVMLLYPIIRSLTVPQQSSTSAKMWRGQTFQAPPTPRPSPLEDLKRRFRSRR